MVCELRLNLGYYRRKKHTFMPSSIMHFWLNGSIHSGNHLTCNKKQKSLAYWSS